jgi:FAD:protein FMN transferase
MVLNAPQSTETVFERIQRSAQLTDANGLRQLAFQAMNTPCRVCFQAPSPAAAREFARAALQWVAEFEARYSRFLPESLISRINAQAGRQWVETDPETEALFNLCQEMVFFTRGAFDPAALPLIRLWNWQANPPVVPDAASIQAARALAGWRQIQRRPGAIFLPREGMCLDLGGIGKEYAVDRVLLLARQHGLKQVLVDFGGDVRAEGAPPGKPAWHIGLEDPRNPGRCWIGVAATHQAVATSGDYLRHFIHAGRRYGHIIDPRDGYPVDNGVRSVSIIAPHCALAGILSTSVFVLGPQAGVDLISLCPGVEGCVTTDHARYPTKGFYAYTTS